MMPEPSEPSGTDHPEAPLAGVRVLDLADRSAALAGRVLADLGAEVILVEPPGGNTIRRLAPFLDGVTPCEASTSHQYFNAGKRSVVLDLAGEGETGRADRSRFLELVASADAVIDTSRPGDLDRLGLGHDDLRTVNADLVQVSVTPFGRGTPWQDRAATDLVACAAGGLVWVSGEPRGTPVHGAADPAHSMAGLAAASAVMTALTGRRLGNHDSGTHIDISLQEAAVMAVMQTGNPTQWTWHGKIPRRPGLSAVLRCADGGYVGLLLRPDRFDNFLDWCDEVGIDHGMTSDDWEWAMLSAPREGNPASAATRALGAALSRDDFAAGALQADMVCLPVLDFADLERYEQYQLNDQFFELDHPGLGRRIGFVRSPLDEVADVPPLRPAPLLDADRHLLDDLAASASPKPGPAAGVGRSSDPDPATALAGLRVVDLTWVLAGPIGTRILAAYGAQVVRVESSTKPDSMRSQIGPDGVPDPDLGGLFNTVNAGKLSLAIDLGHPEGLAAVEELIKGADVVINNFRPGAMDRMGLGYDRLRALNDDVILVNLPGAHRRGPWAVRSSMGNILMAASGFNMLTGFGHERPRGIGIAYPDFTTPPLMVTALLAALRHRDRTGRGQELHLTQLTGLVALMGAEWMHYCDSGVVPPRRANRDPNHCPHGVFPARGSVHSDDEWLAVAVTGDEQWAALCEVIGRPELIDDERFADHRARKDNEDEIDAVVAAWSSELDKWEAADRLQAVGVAAAPVEHIADTYERDPQLRHHYQVVQQPSAPDVDIPIDREPARWRGHDLVLGRAPGLGEHNELVLTEIAGLSSETYLRLLLDGILG